MTFDAYEQRYRDRGITLDAFQADACHALDGGRDVLVVAPTGSGKTVVAQYGVHLAIEQGTRCVYTAPVKALSNQKYHELAQWLGQGSVGLLTGDTTVNRDAQILVMTTEVLRNMLLRASPDIDEVGYVVLDEVHYLADRDRGPVWEEIILSLPPHARLVSLSATISNTQELLSWFRLVRGATTLVESHVRPVPLEQHVVVGTRLHPLYDSDLPEPSKAVRYALGNLDERSRRVGPKTRRNVLRALVPNDLLPAIEFIFSRKGCDRAVADLQRLGIRLTSDAERDAIAAQIAPIRDSLSASDRRAIRFEKTAEALVKGFAAHHAGVLPAIRELTERLMEQGLLKLVYATGTLALGIDMPVRTVVLEGLERWDGNGFVDLTGREYIQLIGRAGRRGKDKVGHALVIGTYGLDPFLLADLGSGSVEPLISAFQPSYNTVVNLLAHLDYRQARALVSRSFAQYQRNEELGKIEGRRAKVEAALIEESHRLECDFGPFTEYLRLRRAAPRASKKARQKAKGSYLRRIAASFRQARNGLGYAYAISGQLTYGLVLSRSPRKLRVIDWSGQVYWLLEKDLSSEMREIGPVPIPQGMSLKTAAAREAICDSLFDLFAERDEVGLDRDLEQSWERFAEPAPSAHLNHPCHRCADLPRHLEEARSYLALLDEKERLADRAETFVDSAGKDFDATVGVLADMGLLQRGENGAIRLGPGAPALQALHLDLDLLLYQCLSALEADALTAEEMSGWASQFLGDDRLGSCAPAQKNLRGLTNDARRETEFLCVLESAWGIERTKEVTPGCVGTFVAWAQGAPLEDCLASSRLSAGDFITAARRLVDLLGQIALAGEGTWIASAAHEARRLVRRGELE